jgi:hypothetical protein
MVSPELVRSGQQALAAVAREAAAGAPLVKCQLLASGFYEALKHELVQAAPADVAERDALMAAAIQCLRVARAAITPAIMLDELERAVLLLQRNPPGSRPLLRVIEGGRSTKPTLAGGGERLRLVPR